MLMKLTPGDDLPLTLGAKVVAKPAPDLGFVPPKRGDGMLWLDSACIKESDLRHPLAPKAVKPKRGVEGIDYFMPHTITREWVDGLTRSLSGGSGVGNVGAGAGTAAIAPKPLTAGELLDLEIDKAWAAKDKYMMKLAMEQQRRSLQAQPPMQWLSSASLGFAPSEVLPRYACGCLAAPSHFRDIGRCDTHGA